MSIYINVTCNSLEPAQCPGFLAVGFDSATETFGDLMAAIRDLGWVVETAAGSNGARCLCPEHAPGYDPGPEGA